MRIPSAVLLLLVLAACGKPEDGWEPVDGPPGAYMYLQRDSIVTAEEGVKLAWVAASLQLVDDSARYDRLETRFRFDCARRRMQVMERRRLLNGKVVADKAASRDTLADASSPQWSPMFKAVCEE